MSKNGYDFYLGLCLLPITPDKLTVKINNANSTLTLIDEGQINILKKAELTDVEFECRIPQTKYPFAKYKAGFLGASFFLSYFENFSIIASAILSLVCPSPYGLLALLIASYSSLSDSRRLNSL